MRCNLSLEAYWKLNTAERPALGPSVPGPPDPVRSKRHARGWMHCISLSAWQLTLHSTSLHCTALRYTTLHYTTLHYNNHNYKQPGLQWDSLLPIHGTGLAVSRETPVRARVSTGTLTEVANDFCLLFHPQFLRKCRYGWNFNTAHLCQPLHRQATSCYSKEFSLTFKR